MIKHFLYNSKDQERSAYIWNTASAMLNAFQTVFILMLISRIDPINDAGVFTIAFAIGNLMMTIGRYGIRQFQVSDVKEKYSFKEYFYSRIFTSIATVAVSLVYVGYQYVDGLYNAEKSAVVFLVCMAKLVDAFEDVLHGMLQQYRRLDIAGKILTLRMGGYIVIYMAAYAVTRNLVVTSAVSLILSVIMFLVLNMAALKGFEVANKRLSLSKIKELLLEGFPLFLSSYFVMYIGNAPKYAIDKVLSSEDQACFNYIFMPVFVIGLMSQFVYQPVIHKLAIMWHKGEKEAFGKIILQQMGIILVLTLAAMTGGYLLGIPVLSLIYGVNLKGYRTDLLVLLAGGGMLAFVNLFHMIITVARKQNWLIWGYLLAFLAFVLGGKAIVGYFGLLGVSVFYSIVVGTVALLFGIMTGVIVREKKNIAIKQK